MAELTISPTDGGKDKRIEGLDKILNTNTAAKELWEMLKDRPNEIKYKIIEFIFVDMLKKTELYLHDGDPKDKELPFDIGKWAKARDNALEAVWYYAKPSRDEAWYPTLNAIKAALPPYATTEAEYDAVAVGMQLLAAGIRFPGKEKDIEYVKGRWEKRQKDSCLEILDADCEPMPAKKPVALRDKEEEHGALRISTPKTKPSENVAEDAQAVPLQPAEGQVVPENETEEDKIAVAERELSGLNFKLQGVPEDHESDIWKLRNLQRARVPPQDRPLTKN
jgi:hypothetical protein